MEDLPFGVKRYGFLYRAYARNWRSRWYLTRAKANAALNHYMEDITKEWP